MFEEFIENISRYPRFLASVILGIFFFLFEKLKPLLNRPVTAVALIGFIAGIFLFITFTLRAMLGLNVV